MLIPDGGSHLIQEVTVFVGGPIQYALGPNGEFDARLREIQDTVITILQDAGFRLLSAHRFEMFGEMDTVGREHEVCARDFTWMRQCDIFVAVLPCDHVGTPVRTDGTCVELGWAAALEKPIIVINSAGGEYSHLVAGLGAVASVHHVDIEHVMAKSAALLEAALGAISPSLRTVAQRVRPTGG